MLLVLSTNHNCSITL